MPTTQLIQIATGEIDDLVQVQSILGEDAERKTTKCEVKYGALTAAIIVLIIGGFIAYCNLDDDQYEDLS